MKKCISYAKQWKDEKWTTIEEAKWTRLRSATPKFEERKLKSVWVTAFTHLHMRWAGYGSAATDKLPTDSVLHHLCNLLCRCNHAWAKECVSSQPNVIHRRRTAASSKSAGKSRHIAEAESTLEKFEKVGQLARSLSSSSSSYFWTAIEWSGSKEWKHSVRGFLVQGTLTSQLDTNCTAHTETKKHKTKARHQTAGTGNLVREMEPKKLRLGAEHLGFG